MCFQVAVAFFCSPGKDITGILCGIKFGVFLIYLAGFLYTQRITRSKNSFHIILYGYSGATEKEHGVARICVIPNWNTYIVLVKIQCYLSASQTNMDIGFTSGHSSEALPITKNTSLIHRFIFFSLVHFYFHFKLLN